MVIPTFTIGYPPDDSSLGQTKVTIRNNLDGTFDTVGVDHINNNGQPGSQPAGYHTIIHEVTQTNVSTNSGYNQIFSGVPGTLVVDSIMTQPIPPDGYTQLYSLGSGGGLHQLTGALPSANGYTWCAGILFQWGIKMSPGNSGNVTFPVQFPHFCFGVQLTPNRGMTTSPQGIYLSTPPLNSGFSYQDSGSGAVSLYWFAIGN